MVPDVGPIVGGKGYGVRVDLGEHEGHIRYFPQSARFEAVCTRNADHVSIRCRLTLYSSESLGKGKKSKHAVGRSLGLLAAWLLGDYNGPPHEHSNRLTALALSLSDRTEGRRYLMTMPNADTVATFERTRREGEPEEPERGGSVTFEP